jgi:ABC-type Fe3+-hydroxamate transport system substrate-binding protein
MQMKKLILITVAVMLTACTKDKIVAVASRIVTTPPVFKRVVILGNSITYAPANLFGGWNGSWGMAASAAENDYVHRLTGYFVKVDSACTVKIRDIIPFEKDWVHFDLDKNLADLKALNPDLVILRIGENVPTSFNAASFGKSYQALTQYFGSQAVVLGVGSFFPRPQTDAVMAKYAPNFISLASIGKDRSNAAWGLWTNPGIEQHPSDKGMAEIADAIWAEVQYLTPIQTPASR